MTVDETKAAMEAIKAARDTAQAFKEERDAALAGRVTAERAKAAADTLVANGTIDKAFRDQAESAFGNPSQTLDFLLNLADDRTKLASKLTDWPELNPGTPVPQGPSAKAASDRSAEDDEWRARMANLRAKLDR